MQSGGYQDRTWVGPRPRVVQGVPGNVRQPGGTEQARRVARDGQRGQRGEPRVARRSVRAGRSGGRRPPQNRGISRRRTAAGSAGGQGERHGVGGQSQNGTGQQRRTGAPAPRPAGERRRAVASTGSCSSDRLLAEIARSPTVSPTPVTDDADPLTTPADVFGERSGRPRYRATASSGRRFATTLTGYVRGLPGARAEGTKMAAEKGMGTGRV